jgi:hypothetical protein
MTIIDGLKQQVALEIGDDELGKEEKRMILQKFGIIPPQLTAQERHIITKEQRRHGTSS